MKEYRYLELIDFESKDAQTESFLKSYAMLHKIEAEEALAHMEKTIETKHYFYLWVERLSCRADRMSTVRLKSDTQVFHVRHR